MRHILSLKNGTLYNTYHFIKEEGYKAVLIEGDRAKFKEMVDNMKEYDTDCICRYVTFNGENRLDKIFAKTKLPKDFSLNHGCTPLSLVKLAESKGYKLIKTTVNNCFFIDEKYFDLFKLEDNSLCKLRTDLSHVTYIFNGYDGHLFVRGYSKLYLHTLPYNEKRMQMIPKWLLGWNIQNKFRKTLQRLHRSLRKRNII